MSKWRALDHLVQWSCFLLGKSREEAESTVSLDYRKQRWQFFLGEQILKSSMSTLGFAIYHPCPLQTSFSGLIRGQKPLAFCLGTFALTLPLEQRPPWSSFYSTVPLWTC